MVMHEEDAVFTQRASMVERQHMRRPSSASKLHPNRQPISEYAYAGHNSAPQHWAAVQLHGKQCRMEISPAPPECEKKLTNGNSPQQYVSAMRLCMYLSSSGQVVAPSAICHIFV